MNCGIASIVPLLLSTAILAQQGSSSIPLAVGNVPVHIFASVATKDGSVAPVDPGNLNVSLDKQRALVVSLRPAKEEKLLFAVMVDTSSSEAKQAEAIKQAATRIFQALQDDGSSGYLVLVDQKVQGSRTPIKPAEVQAMIDKVGFGGGTAFYDGITRTCTTVLGRRQYPEQPRRVLIVLSDGEDNYSHVTLSQAEEAAQHEGIAVFSLSTASSSGQGTAVLKHVSEETGGVAIVGKQLSEGVAPLLAAIEGQSVLEIVPAQPADQKLHWLMIKSTEKGVSFAAPARILLP